MLFGCLVVELAEAQSDHPSTTGFVANARKVLSQTLVCQQQEHQTDIALVHWLLAKLELIRRKQERAGGHALQVTISILNE